jgi:hypothetical protein
MKSNPIIVIPKEGIFSELDKTKLEFINEFFNDILEKTYQTRKIENTEHKKYFLTLIHNDFTVKIGAYIENKYSRDITNCVKEYLCLKTNC